MNRKTIKILLSIVAFVLVVVIIIEFKESVIFESDTVEKKQPQKQSLNIKAVPSQKPEISSTPDWISPQKAEESKKGNKPEPVGQAASNTDNSKEVNIKQKPVVTAEENARELKRMQEMLPGNMWIPNIGSSTGSVDRSSEMRDLIILEGKIRNNTATVEEQKTYYTGKIKMVSDKIDIINYYQVRTQELAKENGTQYLSQKDLEIGQQAITANQEILQTYRAKLAAIE